MTDKLPPKILVVEINDVARTMLCNTIERYWFNVVRAADHESGIRLSEVNKPNVLIASLKSTGKNVLDFIKSVRALDGCKDMPFIFLLDDQDDDTEILKDQSGMVEILKKHYTPNEVMTSIKNLLRKSKPVFQDKVIKYKDVSMDLATYKVMKGQRQVHLGPTEFKILQLLVQSPKTIFSRQQILDYVWGASQKVDTRTVDVHVNRLRSLMKQDPNELPFIKTIRSAGYCLNLPGEID